MDQQDTINDISYPFTALLMFAYENLTYAKSNCIKKIPHREHLFSFSALNFSFMAMENFINSLRELYIHSSLRGSLQSVEESEILSDSLDKYSIEDKWKKYPRLFNRELNLGNTSDWEVFKEIIRYRNCHIHSNFLKNTSTKETPKLKLPLSTKPLSFDQTLSAYTSCINLLENATTVFKDIFYSQALLNENNELYHLVQPVYGSRVKKTFRQLLTDLNQKKQLYTLNLGVSASMLDTLPEQYKKKLASKIPPNAKSFTVDAHIDHIDEDGFSGHASFTITGFGLSI